MVPRAPLNHWEGSHDGNSGNGDFKNADGETFNVTEVAARAARHVRLDEAESSSVTSNVPGQIRRRGATLDSGPTHRRSRYLLGLGVSTLEDAEDRTPPGFRILPIQVHIMHGYRLSPKYRGHQQGNHFPRDQLTLRRCRQSVMSITGHSQLQS